MEQEEYLREGIEWTNVEYFNNKIIVDLIENPTPPVGSKTGAKAGLLALLNEACTLKNVTDMQWLERITKIHEKHDHFVGASMKQKGQFSIKHYAGDVSYQVVGFVDKNNDTIYSDQRKMVETSKDSIIKTMMKNQATDDVKRADSAGTHFKKSLQELIEALSKCRPSYVRCIKPNEQKKALTAEEERFRHQIRYLGLLENIRVRRAGYCNRQTFEEFLQRYKMVVPRDAANTTWPIWRGSARDGCQAIIDHFGWTADMYKFGKTKIFIRKPKELFALENARQQALPMVATMIQSAYRGYAKRCKFLRLLGIVKMQAQWKAKKEREKYEKEKAVVKIQAAVATYLERSQYELLKGAKLIKRNVRRMLARRWLKSVIDLYANAKRANQWGRAYRAQWPKMPSFFAAQEAKEKVFSRIEETWRYKLLLKSIKGREPTYRDKVTALDVFHDKKPWDPAAVWGDHNYLGSELNPHRQAFQESFGRLPSKDSTIYFSDLVDKMNPDGKMVERAIMLTDKGFYRMVPGKYKPDKHNDLSDITKISMTTKQDNLIVIHHETSRDSVINLTFYIGSGAKKELRRTRSFSNIGGKAQSSLMAGARQSVQLNNNNNNNNNNEDPMLGGGDGDDEAERHSEFVVQLLNACKEHTGKVPPVEFNDVIQINVSKKPGKQIPATISALPNNDVPNSTWMKGKGSHQISFK